MRYNTAPKYCTAEKNGLCIVFEKSAEIRNISNIECIFKPIKIIHYNGSNSVIEDSTDVNIQPLFWNFVLDHYFLKYMTILN